MRSPFPDAIYLEHLEALLAPDAIAAFRPAIARGANLTPVEGIVINTGFMPTNINLEVPPVDFEHPGWTQPIPFGTRILGNPNRTAFHNLNETHRDAYTAVLATTPMSDATINSIVTHNPVDGRSYITIEATRPDTGTGPTPFIITYLQRDVHDLLSGMD